MQSLDATEGAQSGDTEAAIAPQSVASDAKRRRRKRGGSVYTATDAGVTKQFDSLTKQKRVWIRLLCDGKGLIEALGSALPSLAERRRVHKLELWLEDAKFRSIVVGRLTLAGQTERAQEIIGYAASVVVAQALSDPKLAMALMPKATARQSRPKRAEPAAGAARSVDALAK